jgi:hypothetical protein
MSGYPGGRFSGLLTDLYELTMAAGYVQMHLATTEKVTLQGDFACARQDDAHRTSGGGDCCESAEPAITASGPEDLVFQSVRTGAPLRDNNVLTRFIKPAGRKLGFGFVNWRSLRTSRATWMIEAGANPKDVQGQMRHSRIQTTLDIYAQFVPESQRRAIEKTSAMVQERIAASRMARAGGIVN